MRYCKGDNLNANIRNSDGIHFDMPVHQWG